MASKNQANCATEYNQYSSIQRSDIATLPKWETLGMVFLKMYLEISLGPTLFVIFPLRILKVDIQIVKNTQYKHILAL